MKLDLKIDAKKVTEMPVQTARTSYTFAPKTAGESLTLVHPDDASGERLIGDIILDQVQLEQGLSFTDYVENLGTESALGAVFRGISELKTQVQDQEGNITRSTKETLRSVFSTFNDIAKGTSTETLESDEGLYRLIKNAQSGTFTEMVNTSDVFSRKIANTASQTVAQQTADNWAFKVQDAGGVISSSASGSAEGIRLAGKHIQLDGDVSMSKAFVTNLIAGNAEIGTAEIGKLLAQSISTSFINADNLEATKAFVKSLTANNVLTNALKADTAFINSLKSTDIDVEKLKGKVIKSSNGDLTLNLDSSHIFFNGNSSAITRRGLDGSGLQFLNMTVDYSKGYPMGLTSIGINRDDRYETHTGNFTGIRIWNGRDTTTRDIELVSLVSDEIEMIHNPSYMGEGWKFQTYPNSVIKVEAPGRRVNSGIYAGDFIFYRTESQVLSLKEAIDTINNNFKRWASEYNRQDILWPIY